MPTVRKIIPPPAPPLPDDLADWIWERHPNQTGELHLRNPERTWASKWYLKNLDRAIAEARRYLTSQPKPTTDDRRPTKHTHRLSSIVHRLSPTKLP